MLEPTPELILNTIDRNQKEIVSRQLKLPAALNNSLKILSSNTSGYETNQLIIDVLMRYVKRPENQEKIARLTRLEV